MDEVAHLPKKFRLVPTNSSNTSGHFYEDVDLDLVVPPPALAPTRTNLIMVNGRLEKIPRPQNAFMLFANDHRKLFLQLHPTECNAQISTRLGQTWSTLEKEKKDMYYQRAKLADIEHKKRYPFYHYTPAMAGVQKRKHHRILEEQGPRKLSDSLKQQRATLQSLVQTVNGVCIPNNVMIPGNSVGMIPDTDMMQVLDPARVQKMMSQVQFPMQSQPLPVRPRRGRPPKPKPVPSSSDPLPNVPRRGRPRKDPNSHPVRRGRPKKAGPMEQAHNEDNPLCTSNSEKVAHNTESIAEAVRPAPPTSAPPENVSSYIPHVNLSMEVLNVNAQTGGAVGLKLISLSNESDPSVNNNLLSGGSNQSISVPNTIQPKLDQSLESSDLSVGTNEFSLTAQKDEIDGGIADGEHVEDNLENNSSRNDFYRHPQSTDSKESLSLFPDELSEDRYRPNGIPPQPRVDVSHQAGDNANVFPYGMYPVESQSYQRYPNDNFPNSSTEAYCGYTDYGSYNCVPAGWGDPCSGVPVCYGECQSYQQHPYDQTYAQHYANVQPGYYHQHEQTGQVYDNQSSGDYYDTGNVKAEVFSQSSQGSQQSEASFSQHITDAMRTLHNEDIQ